MKTAHEPPVIVAIVVTYNRKALLLETLRALAGQSVLPDRIVVIDNNSTDGTAEMLAGHSLSLPLEHVRLMKNGGGAGGFKCGMQCACALGADWLWVMDDDCVPRPEALSALLSALADPEVAEAGFLASRVLWTDGSPCLMNLPVAHRLWAEPHDRQARLSRIVSSSFVSMLVSRRAVERVGFPVAEFFIWFDDVEYSRRVSAGMTAYLVTDSVVEHHTPTNLSPLDFRLVTPASLWKYRYGIRNETAFHRRADSWPAALLFVARVFVRMARAGTPLALRWPLLASCWSGLWFDYTRHIEYPDGRVGGEYAGAARNARRHIE